MPEFPIRKVALLVEEIHHEGGPVADLPRRRAAAMALVANPFAGRYVAELESAMEDLKPLGLMLSERLIAALGGDPATIDGYGKGAIVGTAGELEHGALWHVPGGYAMRERLGEAKAIVPSAKKVGALRRPPRRADRPRQRRLCAKPFRRHGGRHRRRPAAGRDPVLPGHEPGAARACPHGRPRRRPHQRLGRLAMSGEDNLLKLVEADPEAADYRLQEQIGFVLRKAHQRHVAIFAAGIADLTPPQFAALAKLADVGETSQNHLGQLIAMDAATVKGVIDRLKGRGLVALSRHAGDKRRSDGQPDGDGTRGARRAGAAGAAHHRGDTVAAHAARIGDAAAAARQDLLSGLLLYFHPPSR